MLVKQIVEEGGNILSVSERQHSLEDVYLTLIREEKQKADEAN